MKSLFTLMLIMQATLLLAQKPGFADTAALHFKEIKAVTAAHKQLWKIDLYAPVLLVDPVTRKVYANFSDSANVLTADGKIYTGILPKEINISNTSLQWNGREWAMVMLPLPVNYHDRVHLLTHELFHRAQPHLGFIRYNPGNNHLDEKEGRIYLRLELAALTKAIKAVSGAEMNSHIANALAFRRFRRMLYPIADSTENLLEINEGLAELTGLLMSGRNKQQVKAYITKRIENFVKSPSYIRSFAYETVPVYGYLLFAIKKNWNQSVTKTANLGNYFEQAFAVEIPNNIAMLAKGYDGDKIVQQENERAEKIAARLAAYKRILIDSPHVEILLQNMNMSFDYTQMVALEDKGTVYPAIRITDNWGILDVKSAALISPNWNQVNVGYPVNIAGNVISGEGWKLELKENFVLIKDEQGKNYLVKKK